VDNHCDRVSPGQLFAPCQTGTCACTCATFRLFRPPHPGRRLVLQAETGHGSPEEWILGSSDLRCQPHRASSDLLALHYFLTPSLSCLCLSLPRALLPCLVFYCTFRDPSAFHDCFQKSFCDTRIRYRSGRGPPLFLVSVCRAADTLEGSRCLSELGK
jgi:hypothetical protein